MSDKETRPWIAEAQAEARDMMEKHHDAFGSAFSAIGCDTCMSLGRLACKEHSGKVPCESCSIPVRESEVYEFDGYRARRQYWARRRPQELLMGRGHLMAVQTEIGRRLEDAIKRCWEIGGEPTMLRTSSAGGEFLRRWILSGVLVTTAERHHARRTKAARRRNRGRAPFTRFR